MKQCTRCRENKPRTDFTRAKKAPDGLSYYCKKCMNYFVADWARRNKDRKRANLQRWRTNNPDAKVRNKDKRLQRVYGLTLVEFDEKTRDQGGGCAICGVNERLDVDHCHKTGAVRGLLCRACNMSLGGFGDDENILISAMNYLAKYAKGGEIERQK